MIADLLYLTNVRVAAELRERWDEFYDVWTQAFANVPGCTRGSRWEVTEGAAAGVERLPHPEWPVFQAIWEHPALDDFIRSRTHRARPEWQPRARAFEPWFRRLKDYATLHLHCVARFGERGGDELPPMLLTMLWTIDAGAARAFARWYEGTLVPALLAMPGGPRGAAHYVAALAHLHRYGDEAGKLVIPQRHHFEDGTRLVYTTLFHFDAVPDQATRRRLLDAIGTALAPWPEVGDRQEAFVKRLMVARPDGLPHEVHLPAGLPGQDERADIRQQLRLSVLVPAPRARVWERGFATSEAWQRWFPELSLEPAAGAPFRLGAAPEMPLAGSGGVVRAVAAGTRLELAWPWAEERVPEPMTLVFSLTDVPEGTGVELSYQGWERVPEPGRSAQMRALQRRLDALTRVAGSS